MRAICVECWNPEALVGMDLDGSGTFRCGECSAEFTCVDVRSKLEAMKKGWDRLLKWADSYPKEESAKA